MALFPKERIWPTIIVTVLLGNLALGFFLLRVAGEDEHFAVEPDYYRRAVAWDSTMADAEQSAALGWSVVADAEALRAGSPTRLGILVQDSVGGSIVGATVDVEALPVAYATEIQRATLHPGKEAGEYAAEIDLPRTGLWELRITATRGNERVATRIRVQLSEDGPATVVTARPGDPVP